MKKTIGIVTYYDAINEGAFLQAYCLGQFIENRFGIQVRYVQNKCIDSLKQQRKRLFSSKNPRVLINNYRRYSALRKAQKKYLHVDSYTFQYDLIVVGSDEIWNVGNALFSQYNVDGGVSSVQKISYAVSMGNYSGTLPTNIADAIDRYCAISVRDDQAYKIVKETFDREIYIHLDPVFLVDILATTPHALLEKYLMVYGLINDEHQINAIKRLAKEQCLKTVSIDIINKWCDKQVVARSPFEFVWYIDAAELVITNMFHGTMLSIVRNKSFLSLLTERRKFKIQNAAQYLGFTDWCFMNDGKAQTVYAQMKERLLKTPDYDAINEKVQSERVRTYQYFKTAIYGNPNENSDELGRK